MQANSKKSTAVFGGGCFWCTEAVFKMLRGVAEVSPGYTGGTIKNPTYEQVSSGETGHAEVIRIEYDPNVVQYRDLLTVFFASHDPTTMDRQGNDIGTQYRSAIFYSDPDQQKQANAFIAELNRSNSEGNKIVTAVAPLGEFYPAENYHKDYFEHHKDAPYCQLVIDPKLEKVQKDFAELLKDN